MATISETELQRRLRSLEKSTGTNLSFFVSDIDPSGTGYKDGDTHYNSATGNLYVFSGGSWNLSVTKLHFMYADAVTNISVTGIAAAQNDVTGFSALPFTAAGVQKVWRGQWFGGADASTDPTDYVWTLTSGADGYSPQEGVDYDDGIDGNNIRIEYSTDGSTWVTTQQVGTVYAYIRTCQDTNNNGVYVCGITSKFIPEKGVEYDDGGTVAQITIYKRSATALATPTGGQYAFATRTLTAPTGWASSIPTGTDPVYSCITMAHIIGNTATDTTLTWSSPESIISDGVAGLSVYTTNVFHRSTTAPGTPVSDTGSFAFGTNLLSEPTGNPSTQLWTRGIPSGTDPLYASEATFSVSGGTGTDSTVDWGAPRVVSQNGETGLDGLSTYLFSVFKRSTTAPATPTTGSYNFTTNTPTAPTGWSTTVPSGTDPLYVTTTLASTAGPTGSDSTLTWSSPVIMARDGYSPVKGTDYDDGISGNNVRVEYSTDNSTWVSSQASGVTYLYIRTGVDSNNNGVYVNSPSSKFVPVKGVEYDDGDPGTNAYVHIKYSDNGTSFTANAGEDVGSWLGTYADSTVADSTTFSDYTWKEIVGADGYSPIKGTDYDDGVAGNNVRVEYSTDNSTWVTTQAANTVYLYIRTAVDSNGNGTYVAGTSTKYVPELGVEYNNGADGYTPVKGTDYDDGVAGNNVRVEYSTNNSTWVTTQVSGTTYLYIRTAVDSNGNGTYVAGTSTKYVPELGTEYNNGADGVNAYVHIKYSNNGTSFTANSGEDVGSWIGTYSDSTAADSTTFSSYTWKEIVGDDGVNAYVHIKYSDNGTSFTANSGETVGSWIGTLANSTLADSTTFSDYTWKEIVGADGYTPIKNTDYFDGTSSYLHIKYSTNGTTFSANGGETPAAWIGLLNNQTIADSTTFSDYTWRRTTPNFERYYSITPGLLSQMGDPTTPGTGITWTQLTGTPMPAAPTTAYWIADRFTMDGSTSDWELYPVQAKDGGIPFVKWTKSGYNMPTLGDSTWIADAVLAVKAFTGRNYTNQREFGYGTTVVIQYDNGKLSGRFVQISGVDSWVAPADFIDGDLIVDGSISAAQISATAINSTHLTVSGNDAINYATVGADASGAAATAKTGAELTASNALGVVTTNIYTAGSTKIDGGQITTGSITADIIAAGAITSGKLTVTGTGAITPGFLGAATTAENTTAATTANWSTVTDDNSNMPADNATAGATWGTDLSGQPSDTALLNTNTTPSDIGYTGDLDANNITNTSDLTDGANLGGTAAWATVTGTSGVETSIGSAAKVAVVTDNIYTANTTTIDGGTITTGSVSANKITVNDRIDFSENSSGLAFSKTSLADSTVGGYYGRGQDRDGNNIVGMSISSAASSFTVDSSGTLAMVGVKLYTGTPGTPTAFTAVTTTATYPISASSPTINILLIGAGGGGAGNKQNAGAGSAGVSTIIKVRNSSNQVLYVRDGTDGSSASDVVTSATSGFTIQQFTAAGGAGGVNFGANNVGYTGGTGGSSSKGTGGAGSGANYNSPTTPTPGSGNGAGGGGAGSPWVTGTTAGYGGDAGAELTITGYVPPNGASNIIVTIGSGGAGGLQSTYSGGQAGAAGSVGYVSVADPTSGGDIVDLASISDKFSWPVPVYSSTSTLSNQVNRSQTEVNLGSGGAGWYLIQNISSYGGKIQNLLNVTGNVNVPNIENAYPVLYYCTGTPRLQSTTDGNTYYFICTVKWFKLA